MSTQPEPATEAGRQMLDRQSDPDWMDLDHAPKLAAILAIEQEATAAARADAVIAMENEGVVEWGDPRHRERFLALVEPAGALGAERLRCGQCGDELLPSEIEGHLLSEGRSTNEYERGAAAARAEVARQVQEGLSVDPKAVNSEYVNGWHAAITSVLALVEDAALRQPEPQDACPRHPDHALSMCVVCVTDLAASGKATEGLDWHQIADDIEGAAHRALLAGAGKADIEWFHGEVARIRAAAYELAPDTTTGTTDE